MFILGIVGKKQSGKDTVAAIIQRLMQPKRVDRIAFADALKEEVGLATNSTVEFIDANKDNFRLILQGWGTDFRRKLHGDTYWLVRWLDKVNHLPVDTVVVAPDVRFTNEAWCIRKLGGKLWRVVRKVNGAVDLHTSETEQEDIKTDLALVNDGSMAELEVKVKQAINTLKA